MITFPKLSRVLIFAKTFGIYYFIFVIVLLYLIAPLFLKLKKHIFKFCTLWIILGLICTILYEFNFELFNDQVLRSRNILVWGGFFAGGILSKRYYQVFQKIVANKNIYPLCVIALFLVIVNFLFDITKFKATANIIWYIYSFIAVLFLFKIGKFIKPKKIITYLASCSYSIYLLHIIPIQFVSQIVIWRYTEVSRFIENNYIGATLILFIASIVFSLFVIQILRHIFPKNSKYIIGS